MSSVKTNEYLKLAKASTAKIKGIARGLANPKGLARTRQSEERNFFKRLADQLHAVGDWLESLKSSRDIPISTLEKLLNNLERLCEVILKTLPSCLLDSTNGTNILTKPPKSSKSGIRTSTQAYSALKRLNFSSDGATAAIIKLGQANSQSAIKRQDALLRILARISLSPSPELVEPPYNTESSESDEQPMDSWFKPRLDMLYKVFSSLGLFEVPEEKVPQTLTSRLCLANSKMLNNKTLKVAMLVGLGDKPPNFPHWRETQIEICPKDTRVNFPAERCELPYPMTLHVLS